MNRPLLTELLFCSYGSFYKQVAPTGLNPLIRISCYKQGAPNGAKEEQTTM